MGEASETTTAGVPALLTGRAALVTGGSRGIGRGIAEVLCAAALIPLHKLGDPRDIGGAVLYLASDRPSFVTGRSLVVDGGQTLPEIPG